MIRVHLPLHFLVLTFYALLSIFKFSASLSFIPPNLSGTSMAKLLWLQLAATKSHATATSNSCWYGLLLSKNFSVSLCFLVLPSPAVAELLLATTVSDLLPPVSIDGFVNTVSKSLLPNSPFLLLSLGKKKKIFVFYFFCILMLTVLYVWFFCVYFVFFLTVVITC